MGEIRKSVGFGAGQADWIEQQSDELGRSQAEIVRRAVEFARDNDADLRNGASNTTEHRSDERIDELENVVGELAEQVDRIDKSLMSNERAIADGSRIEVAHDPAPTGEPVDTTASDTEALDDVDFPAGQDRDACLAAIDTACEYLRESGPASMREIVSEVMPERPLGYDVPDLGVGDRYRGSWWRSVVKPGLEAYDAVEYNGNAGYEWVGSR